MHSAPSVSYPVGRCRLALLLATAAWCTGALVLAGWTWQLAPGWRQALGAAVLAVAGGAAWQGWRRSPSGLLAWDGQGWRWADGHGERGGRAAVALDLQRWLLLHWRADGGGAQWLWLEREREPASWDALRRAVYSPARTDAPPGAQPPAART